MFLTQDLMTHATIQNHTRSLGMKARKSLIGMCLAVLGLPGVASAGPASGRVLLVLDSSGSMQEQIDGRQRMDLATEAMREFLGNLDRLDLEIAFMAYGRKMPSAQRTPIGLSLPDARDSLYLCPGLQ